MKTVPSVPPLISAGQLCSRASERSFISFDEATCTVMAGCMQTYYTSIDTSNLL